MAPEQLAGQHTDGRTDIFAFGAVVFEMAAGRRAFEGQDSAGVMAAILEHDPPPLSVARAQHERAAAHSNEAAPPLLDQIISKCLEKNPDDRWQSARDLGEALKWVTPNRVAPPAARAASAQGWRGPIMWIAGGLVIAALAISLSVALLRRAPSEARLVRFVVTAPENVSFSESSAFLALSPDGRSLAISASFGGKQSLWIRSLESVAVRQLPGSEGGGQVFWSPDSRFLGFKAGGKLKTIEVAGGLPTTLGDWPLASTGSWNSDGVILAPGHPDAKRTNGGIYQISSAGGAATPVTTLDSSQSETNHAWPQFLPDGRHFIYHAKSSEPEHDSIAYVASLDSKDRVRLFRTDSHVAYAPPGYLIYLQANTLLAQPFDTSTLRVTGGPVPIADKVERTAGSNRGAFSVSTTGVLAYRSVRETQLVWFDRGGRRHEAIGPAGHYSSPALSPDERRLAYARQDLETGTSDIWQLEFDRGVPARFTFGPEPDDMPLWSPNGSRILFKSLRGGRWGFYQKASSGTGPEELLMTSVAGPSAPYGWSGDGQLLYASLDSVTGRYGLWRLPASGKPVELLKTPFFETQGQPSTDGRWIAYVSNESGIFEVYVRPFPSGEGKWPISVAGGTEPRWRGDGKELFYLASDNSLQVVSITTTTSRLDASPPKTLFQTATRSLALGVTRNQYVVTADGQRFLFMQPAEGPSSSSITVVLNWTAALRQ
jgi:eukaryotic-like serine/threonine-protein kinase